MNTPKIRFKEFNDEWKYEPLSNYVDRIITKNKDNVSSLVLTISAQFGLVDQTRFFNKNVSSNNLAGYYLLNKGDFAYNKSYSNGYPWGAIKRLNKYNMGVVSSLYICFKPNKKINSDYLEQYFETNKWYHQMSEVSVEGARNHGLLNIAVGDFFSTEHFIPTLDEQKKISKFLSLLDKKIELQSKKIEDLKLFTKNTISNELNNLQNYNIFKFKDICNIQTGKSNTQDKCDDGIYPFYIRSENIEKSNNYIFDCEAVLTIGDGNIGKVFFYENGKFDCHQRVYVLNNFKNVLGKYVYYYFSSFFYKRAMSMSAKNTVDSVRMEMISDMIIKVPQEKEQIKMINLFSCLDKKLGLEQNKLDKLQKLKKGLMQNMFV